MTKYFLIFGAVFVLLGCEKANNTLVCDKYTVEIKKSDSADILDIVINDDAAILNHVVSASGARYSGILNDTNVELWDKGRNWTLTLNDEQPISCK